MSLPVAMIGGLGYGEMLIVGLIALLLFGKRLPEVARSLGKSVVEFKKGIRGIEEDAEDMTQHRQLPHSTDTQAPRAPKFEPPTSPPTEPPAGSDAAQLDSLKDVDRHRDQPTTD